MRHPLYLLRRHYSAVVATLALVVALTSAGAMAGTVLIGSKQIRNGSILTQDIHKGGVKSSDIANSTVQSGDIGAGEVEPQDVTMPEPEQLQESDVASAPVGTGFALVDTVGTYAKEDPTSILQVDWTGTAAATEINCVFQLRVDGAASASGAGVVFVGADTDSTTSVAASALFEGLSAGPHTVEVWARLSHGSNPSTCIVGPAGAGISQTFIVSEQVV